MKHSHQVNRPGRGQSVRMSLFPFLAVLTCTMGSLLVLLVIFTQQARRRAADELAGVRAERQQRFETLRDAMLDKVDQLDQVATKLDKQLVQARFALGNVEEHRRSLREDLLRLTEQRARMPSSVAQGNEQREILEGERRRLEEEIARSIGLLAEAEQDAATKTVSYAIVPYQGQHGTSRRPIYIECRAEGVVLRPEGLRLNQDDFLGPLGPGNPLDAALRAIREYMVSSGRLTPDGTTEPYPLLLVRPSGIDAYYAARSAMQSWGGEFGYELIGEDWPLEFDAPDPDLAVVLGQTVAEARMRQQLLITAAPIGYGSQPRTVYRASPTQGGFVRQDGGDISLSDGAILAPPRLAEPAPPYAGTGNLGHDGPALSGPPAGGTPQSLGDGRGGQGENPLSPGPSSLGDVPPTAGGTPQSLGDGRGGQGENPPSPGPSSLGDVPPEQSPSVRPLAQVRGRNWGLPGATSGAMAITRPLRVDCFTDRLVLMPEGTTQTIRVIPITGPTHAAIEGFVSVVWERIEGWGMAGNDMYWRPQLTVHVAEGGERRFDELAVLLEGSGLIVQRR